MAVFDWRTTIPASAQQVFDWHARPGAFERLAAPWQDLRVVERSGGLEEGAVLVFAYHMGPLRGRWVALHENAVGGRSFTDRQIHGPFASWEHTHSFIPQGEDASALEDHIEYALPGGNAGALLGQFASRKGLERLFRFRHARTAADLSRYRETADGPRLTVAVTGATGLIGAHLAAFLEAQGHAVRRIVRGDRIAPGDILWDPLRGRLDAASLEGVDAVVHLAAESTAGRWTHDKKSRIMASRVDGTALVARVLAGMRKPPGVLVSVSAVGYYGDRGDELLDEESAPGGGFLAEVARRWEGATAPASEAGIRVVNARMGVVVTAAGGAVGRMLPAFRAATGGVIGSGDQWWSWVALDDAIAALTGLLLDDGFSGAVNVVSPEPLTNREFVKTLGRVLSRPTIVRLPARAVDAAFGEMGRAMLLEGQRVRPARLLDAGFRFGYPRLEDALRLELGRLKE